MTTSPRSRLLDNQVRQLVARHEAGLSVCELTAEFGIHRETVMEHPKRTGVARRPNIRNLTDTQVLQAAARYAGGLSLLDVALEFTVNANTLRREFSKAGVAVRPRRGWDR